jgi:hypothetical protein
VPGGYDAGIAAASARAIEPPPSRDTVAVADQWRLYLLAVTATYVPLVVAAWLSPLPLRKIGAVIDELPVWPFDATTLRRFLTAYVVPALGAASVPLLKWLFPVVFPQLNDWLT